MANSSGCAHYIVFNFGTYLREYDSSNNILAVDATEAMRQYEKWTVILILDGISHIRKCK